MEHSKQEKGKTPKAPRTSMRYDQLLSSGTIKCGEDVLILHIRGGLTRTADLSEAGPSKYRINLKDNESQGEKAAEFEWSMSGIKQFGEEGIKQAGLDQSKRRNWPEIIYYQETKKEKCLKNLNAEMLGIKLDDRQEAGAQKRSAAKRKIESGIAGGSHKKRRKGPVVEGQTDQEGDSNSCNAPERRPLQLERRLENLRAWEELAVGKYVKEQFVCLNTLVHLFRSADGSQDMTLQLVFKSVESREKYWQQITVDIHEKGDLIYEEACTVADLHSPTFSMG
jgi:hypothetical protein